MAQQKKKFHSTRGKERQKTNLPQVITPPNEDLDHEQIAMFELTKPFEPEHGFFQRIWEKMHHPMHQINWMTFFFTMAVITLLTVIITIINVRIFSDERHHSEEKFGLIARLEALKQSHDYYTTMATKDEMLVSWIKLFGAWKYRMGGDPRYNNGDCVGAVYEFLKKWNSNVYFDNVQGIVSRCENLAERGELLKRTRIEQVKTGDIIIIQLEPNRPQHAGIVYDTPKGQVRYMDVNAGVMTWGLEREIWGSSRIYAVYEMSYSLWIGNLMKKINEVR